MEKRIKQKVDTYFKNLNNDLINWCNINKDNETISYDSIIEYINSKEQICLDITDFQKRKRTKNIIPQFTRCCAKRANGEQCTRKRKEDITYCGTHEKNRPHGTIEDIKENLNIKKKEVWLQDINGILYYIDNDNNVYNNEDILNNVTNPEVLYKYNFINNKYSIIQ
tara:strand:+ start:246 stop:746 length:501 start_codon:yes stop_codon:yes gene_type:complete